MGLYTQSLRWMVKRHPAHWDLQEAHGITHDICDRGIFILAKELPERVQDELDSVGNANLVEDAENVVLHRMFTEVELSRDIAVA